MNLNKRTDEKLTYQNLIYIFAILDSQNPYCTLAKTRIAHRFFILSHFILQKSNA